MPGSVRPAAAGSPSPSPTSATGGPATRSTCSCPTRCCSGCRATWTCSSAGPAPSLPAAGWPCSYPATSISRATRSCATWPRLAGRAGCRVDAWETTYLHVLPGDDPVLEWYKGTGLRPVLAALPPQRTADFLAEYAARARDAYPPAPYGTVLPFRRVFVVATRP